MTIEDRPKERKVRDWKTLKNFVKEGKKKEIERFVRLVKKIEMEQNEE